MSAESVWVQLLKDEDKKESGEPFEISLTTEEMNINGLKESVITTGKLDYGPQQLRVYEPGTDFVGASSADPRAKVKDIIEEKGYTKQTLLTQIWRSVLRLENTTTDELATGLVFDVFEDRGDLCMLLLMNRHFNFKGKELVRAMGYDEAGQVSLVESFTRQHVQQYYEVKDEDFVIYQLYLDKDEWEMPEPGLVRRLSAAAAPAAAAEPPAKKRRASARKQAASEDTTRAATSQKKPAASLEKTCNLPEKSERLRNNPNPNVMKKADVICKTPPYRYDIYLSMSVRVFGFPHTARGRWEGIRKSNVTSVDRNTFGFQMLSAPGLSGGAVVATEHGEVIGIMGGNQDASQENGKDQLFNAYAIHARSFPCRPSSGLQLGKV